MAPQIARCLFCGGAAEDPGHLARCDGRQGRREGRRAPLLPPPPPFNPRAAFGPVLASGLDPATYATSRAAALEADVATERARVLEAIQAAGPEGRTDDELQAELGLDGNTERPRRWELWKQARIQIARTRDGKEITRRTRTDRRAVVWVAVA